MHIPGHGEIPGYPHIEDAENWLASPNGPIGSVRLPGANRNPLGATSQIISWTEGVNWSPYNE